MFRVQLCTKDNAGLYKTIRDVHRDVQNDSTVYWICDSYARLENPAACSQLEAFQLVPSPDLSLGRQFHQVCIAEALWKGRVRTCHLHTVSPAKPHMCNQRCVKPQVLSFQGGI